MWPALVRKYIGKNNSDYLKNGNCAASQSEVELKLKCILTWNFHSKKDSRLLSLVFILWWLVENLFQCAVANPAAFGVTWLLVCVWSPQWCSFHHRLTDVITVISLEWALWYLKSLAIWLFIQQIVWLKHKSFAFLILCIGNPLVTNCFLHSGPRMRKRFPCQDIVMVDSVSSIIIKVCFYTELNLQPLNLRGTFCHSQQWPAW